MTIEEVEMALKKMKWEEAAGPTRYLLKHGKVLGRKALMCCGPFFILMQMSVRQAREPILELTDRKRD